MTDAARQPQLTTPHLPNGPSAIISPAFAQPTIDALPAISAAGRVVGESVGETRVAFTSHVPGKLESHSVECLAFHVDRLLRTV